MLTGFAWHSCQGLSAGLPEKAPRRGIILAYILSQRCPQPVPHNYSKCDCVVGFGISEMQTPFLLPSHIHPALPLPLGLFCLQQFHHMQNGGASQKVFQGLEPFQPLTTMAVQMQSCDLGNSSYPALFQPTGGGDVVPDLRSR